MTLPLLPIAGGLLLVGGGTALALRKKKIPPGLVSQAKIKLNPADEAARKQPLPPVVLQKLATRGPPPSQRDIDVLKIQQAAGQLDLSTILKATDGTIFANKSPPPLPSDNLLFPDSEALQMGPGDKLTVDVDKAGFHFPSIPSGNMFFLVKGKADLKARTIPAQSADPRLPDDGPITGVPLEAITGVQPGE